MFSIKSTAKPIQYCNTKEKEAEKKFCKLLIPILQGAIRSNRPIICLCIGSDRATGDALGPLVGQNLLSWKKRICSERKKFLTDKKRASMPTLFIYGTLDYPVHAMNLSDTIIQIYQEHTDPFIIAIDASLGIKKHIGYVTCGQGPLFPGIGVGKQLPAIGNIHITGIVNCCQNADRNQILQTTRLSTVVELTGFITNGIARSLIQ